MSEFFSDVFVSMLGVLWALTLIFVMSKLFSPAKKEEEITYEYKFCFVSFVNFTIRIFITPPLTPVKSS